MEENQPYTLADSVDLYLAQRMINKKKYYSSYLICAREYWKRLFKNTIYATNSQWFTLQKGVPYNFINIPANTVRIFSVSVNDSCGRLKTLYYDSSINAVAQPTSSQKKCGCKDCDCGGLCEDVNSLTYTTRVVFTINGVDYIEKKWVKVCPNGDVIEYRIVPTKKYNTFAGDGGDYMNDYMNDYDIGAAPFSDYTIEYPEFQKVICKLEVKPCGCPENTQENIDTLNDYCGCYLRFNSFCNRKKCDTFLGEVNGSEKLGSVKISECGKKILYIPHESYNNKNTYIPEFLQLNWQTSGEKCSEIVEVPEYALNCMYNGIDFFSKRFNSSYSGNEKLESKYAMQDAENDLVVFLNQISLKWLSNVADSPIVW